MVELKSNISTMRNAELNPSAPAFAVKSTDEKPFNLKPQLMEIWSGAKDLAGAEGRIVAMKATRFAVIGVFGMVALPVFVALVIYGFTLLDAAARIALERTGIDWLAPLVRGSIYCGVPMILFLVTWHLMVGWGTSPKEKRNEVRHA